MVLSVWLVLPGVNQGRHNINQYFCSVYKKRETSFSLNTVHLKKAGEQFVYNKSNKHKDRLK